MLEYQPGGDLSSTLGTYVNNYENEYLDYWNLQNVPDEPQTDEDARELFAALEDLGANFRESLHSLEVDPDAHDRLQPIIERVVDEWKDSQVDPAQVAKAALALMPARDRLKIALGWEATEGLLATAEERLPALLKLIAGRSLGERARAYLNRATRLFLWGFDPECVVMCHSVLEAALSSQFGPDRMENLGFERKRDYRAVELERAAGRANLFEEENMATARVLRRARNDIVHGHPDITMGAEEAINAVASLLDQLFAADD